MARYLTNKFFEGDNCTPVFSKKKPFQMNFKKQYYSFWVNGVNEIERWEKLRYKINSEIASCEMWRYWEKFDKQIHDFHTYCDHITNPFDLGVFARCAYCDVYGPGVKWNLEHILPRKYYPQFAFDTDNIVLACNQCNEEKCNRVGKSVGELVLPYQIKLANKKQVKLLEIG